MICPAHTCFDSPMMPEKTRAIDCTMMLSSSNVMKPEQSRSAILNAWRRECETSVCARFPALGCRCLRIVRSHGRAFGSDDVAGVVLCD